MARAMWKATLQLQELELPVKLYAAVEDRAVHFRLLHAEDHVPVVQRMVDPASGEEVRKEQVRRGVELEPGVFVLLSAAELAREAPQASRAIEVLRCVPRAAVDPAWWSRPYLLGPDGREDEYYALARALEDAGRYGVARWVMRGKRYAGALAPREGRLALVTLQPSEAVVAAEQLAKPEGPQVRKGERELAEQLVAALDAPFDPAALRDEHRERVLELVEAKAAGKKPRLAPVAAKRPTDDLTRALRESLRAARERRVA
jgi:DNA end-binding protein Ku